MATNLEREKAARLRIEMGLASRHVTVEQRAALKDALKDVKLEIVLSTYGNPEATAYTDEVGAALIEAGQTVKRGGVVMAGGGNIPGLLIEENADKRLIAALKSAGLLTQLLSSQKNPMFQTGEGLNALVVGLKPSAF